MKVNKFGFEMSPKKEGHETNKIFNEGFKTLDVTKFYPNAKSGAP